MKRIFLAIIACLVLVLCLLFVGCNNEEQPDEELSYMPCDGGWSVCGLGSFDGTELVIPTEYEGQPVKEIGERAFSDISSITSVKIPDSVEKIGDYAFEYCINLVSVEIGGVKDMGENVFSNCESLKTVNIKEGVQDLGMYTFLGCSSLREIAIPSTIEIINDSLFAHLPLENVTLAEGIKEIGSNAFELCDQLEAITLPNSLEKIGVGAFSGCDSLKDITFGSGLKEIADYAFLNCYALEKLQLNEGLETVDVCAFAGCDNLMSIVIPSTVTSINVGAYRLVEVYNLSSLSRGEIGGISEDAVVHTSLDEPSVLTKTEDGFVFFDKGNEVLLINYTGDEKEITLPEKFNEKTYNIRGYAFYEKKDILSMDIPDTVTNIGDFSFEFCENLVSLVLPKNLKPVSYATFWNCYRLVEIYNLPHHDLEELTKHFHGDGNVLSVHKSRDEASTVTVTEDGFVFCDNGEKCVLVSYVGDKSEITLPEKFNGIIYEVNAYAFINNSTVNSVIVPDTVTKFGEKAFYGSSLSDISLPKTMTSLDVDIFEDCYNNLIEFENGIYYIDKWAVDCEKSITEAVLREDTFGIATAVFQECEQLTSVKLPASLEVIGERAFSNCTSLTNIYIPKSVRIIENIAFSFCHNLVIMYESEENNIESATVWNLARPEVWGAKEYGVSNDGFVWVLNSKDEIVIADYIGSGTALVIPSELDGHSVTGIADYAFYENETLTSVQIPASVSYVGIGAFKRSACISQDENGAGYVDKWVVDCDFGATEVSLRNDTVGIVSLAFNDCSMLEAVIVPNSVLYVGNAAFVVCPNLTIYCEASEQSVLWHTNWNIEDNAVVWGYTAE